MLRTHPAEILIGERVELKRLALPFAEVIFKAIDLDRERLSQFLPWVDHMKTVQDEANYLQGQVEDWNQANQFNFAIFLKESDEYVGNIGAHSISFQHERCEVGYWLRGKFESQGYMTESVKLPEKELFKIGFHRIEIHCSSSNLRSAAVPLRCGYSQEALLRENAIENGRFRNTLVFGKLKSES